MSQPVTTRLDELARTDPAVAPLALLQAEAYRAAADPSWDQAVPAFDSGRLAEAMPLLHGQTVNLEPGRVQQLFEQLAAVAEKSGAEASAALRRALGEARLDPLAVLEASIVQDNERLESMAAEADVDADLLATLGQILALPLLQACGRRAAASLEGLLWESGYCPVCGAWPTLAELRGLERKRWLRCGRCGSSWWCYQQRCIYCGSLDHRKQGYLAPEADLETRRAAICDDCHGYLKTVSTFGPLPPDEIGVQDLTTLELDLAALEQSYGRPKTPGFPLRLQVVAVPRPSGLFRWRRPR